MPSAFTYPGVYVEEIPSGVRTISGVSTSDTAFVDFFSRGPMRTPARVTSFDEFTRVFGGLDARSPASYGIQQFFANGGQVAWVVRVAAGAPRAAQLTLQGGSPLQNTLTVTAANEGVWGNQLQVAVDSHARDTSLFNLVVRQVSTAGGRSTVLASETHRNLSMDRANSRYVVSVVNNASALIRVQGVGLGQLPTPASVDATRPDVINNPDTQSGTFQPLGDSTNPASDGNAPDAAALSAGIQLLDRIEPFTFSLLCIPAASELDAGSQKSVLTNAVNFCEQKRVFLLVDVPSTVDTIDEVNSWQAGLGLRHRNAAVYFPRLVIPDPLNEFRPRNVAASGTVAGVYSRTDSTRGVWKAPAGIDADLRGADPAVGLNEMDNGALNPLGVNVLRSFPVYGPVVWGARTMVGSDQEASEWKYIPVRRLAMYIEESLSRGLKWVVFEPNDEPLWGQIRLNVGAFMQTLFRQGAFQGSSARDAYFVKCDSSTTTQTDINLGVVNILVGFAPLKPAEFVVIRIQQAAGQSAS